MQMGVNVLSLFNGMSTGQTALINCGVKINKYYSSEIKPHAIELTQHHYPDTVQLGDVNNWREWDIDFSSIDLLLSGSPCKDLSVAGKRKGIYGSNSGLFWVFIDILNHIKGLNPNVIFLQENVGSAPKNDIGIMSRALGVYPTRINSKLVTAQLRDRYYWTNGKTKKSGLFGENITNISSPKDKKISIAEITTGGWEKEGVILYAANELSELITIQNNEVRVKTNTVKGYTLFTESDCLNLSFPKSTSRRGRVTRGKCPCLLEVGEPLFVMKNMNFRKLNKEELCMLQGFSPNHCDILSFNKTQSLLGDGWTLPIIEHIFLEIGINKKVC